MKTATCPRCKGSGIEPGTGITFTPEDLDEWYGDDWDERDEAAKEWGRYGLNCVRCNGNTRVRLV